MKLREERLLSNQCQVKWIDFASIFLNNIVNILDFDGKLQLGYKKIR